jgi:hypothetical protein
MPLVGKLAMNFPMKEQLDFLRQAISEDIDTQAAVQHLHSKHTSPRPSFSSFSHKLKYFSLLNTRTPPPLLILS